MRETQFHWLVTALVTVVAVLGTLLAVHVLDDGSRYALAQMGGASGDIVAITGEKHSNRLPLFVIDSKKKAIMVYEYDQASRKFHLRAARRFLHDRELTDESFQKFGISKGPSVDAVRKIVMEEMKKGAR